MATFQNRCVASALSETGIDYSSNPEKAYVDCVDGKVRGNPSQTCEDACMVTVNEVRVSKCCIGGLGMGTACSYQGLTGFTGKGKRVIIHSFTF